MSEDAAPNPGVRFGYVIPAGVEPSEEDRALMKAIDERMKARNRELRKAGGGALRAAGKGGLGFRYKVTMPDGTVVDEGSFRVAEADLAPPTEPTAEGG